MINQSTYHQSNPGWFPSLYYEVVRDVHLHLSQDKQEGSCPHTYTLTLINIICLVREWKRWQKCSAFLYSSCWTKGLAISSLPSTGEMSTMSVPRATTRPRERVVSLPASSAALRLVRK